MRHGWRRRGLILLNTYYVLGSTTQELSPHHALILWIRVQRLRLVRSLARGHKVRIKDR